MSMELLSRAETNHLTLHQLSKILNEIDFDVRWIVDEFDYLLAAGTSPRYCLDFDTLFPFIDTIRDEPARESEFWSSLLIDFETFPVSLLPGTLFEILTFTQDKLTELKRLSESAIGSAFIDAVSELRFQSDHEYHWLESKFREAVISDKNYYLLTLIQRRASPIKGHLPQINRDLFYQCLLELSRGIRASRIVNNRVDAYNYTLVTALNQHRSNEDRFLLVSNSHYLRQLDTNAWHSKPTSEDGAKMIPQFAEVHRGQSKRQYRRNVITPRRAAIFQLLASAGDGIDSNSRRHAWELLIAISDAQARIASVMARGDYSKAPFLDSAAVRGDNVFLDLISSFVVMKDKIEAARQQNRENIELFARNYSVRNPIAFFEDLHQAIQKVLHEVVSRDFSRDELPRKDVNLRVVTRSKDDRFSYGRHADALTPNKEIVFSYFDYSTHHLFLSESGTSIESFIAIYNTMNAELFAKVAAKHYGEWPIRNDISIVVGSDRILEERPLDQVLAPLTLKNIAELFGAAESKINFVRLKQSWFDLSYEGSTIALSTEYPIIDEIAFFLREIAKPVFRGAPYERLVRNLMNQQPAPT